MTGGLENFISALEFWTLIDIMVPSFFLMIILSFLCLAIISQTGAKTIVKFVVSVLTGIVLTLLAVIGNLTDFLASEFDLINATNLFLPQIVLYTIPYIIALFPLASLISSRKFFNLTVLSFYTVSSILNISNMLLLLLPLSVISLIHAKRYKFILFKPIRYIALVFSLTGLAFIVLLFLNKDTEFYQFIVNLLGIGQLYVILVIWVSLWLAQTIILWHRSKTG